MNSNLDCTTAYGLTFWLPEHDEAVGRCLRDAGEFARIEVEFILDSLKDRETGFYIDVGANLGATSLPVAARMPKLRVLAMEPNLPVYSLLCANLIQNRLTNIEAFPWAIGATNALAEFPYVPLTAKTNFGAVGYNSGGVGRLPTVSLRLDALRLNDVRFLKIDVEGYDLEVLQGADALLRDSRPTILFEGRPGAKTETAIQWLWDRDYLCYWFYAPFVTAGNPKGAPIDRDAWAGDINIVAVPKGQAPAWTLPVIAAATEDWRSRLTQFTYLQRYRD